MSDFPFNEQNEQMNDNTELENADALNTQGDDDVFSTIFSAPVEHRGKKAENVTKKKRWLAVVAAALAVAILVGGTFAVIKLIPVKDEDDLTSQESETIEVLKIDADTVNAVTLTNSNGTFKFLPVRTEEKAEEEKESSVTTTWTVEGVDKKFTDSSAILSKVMAATEVTAIREIDGRTPEDCGFDKAVYKAVIDIADAESRTLEVGSASSDGMGNYMRVSGDDKIYFVEADALSAFDFKLLDLANSDPIAGLTATESMGEYTDESGAITTFDTITVTGKNFDKPLVIGAKNDDSQLSAYFNHVILSDDNRFADNVTDLFNVFVKGVSVSGAYAFDVSAESLKAVGLDTPYLTATIKIGNTTSTIKIDKVDENYCAVITDKSYMIHKVEASSFTFLDYSAESFYNDTVFIENIVDLSEFNLTAGEESYTFGISYDEEAESDEQIQITYKGEKIAASPFQDFYQKFVGLQYEDYNTDFKGTAMDMIITVKFLDGRTATVSLAKASATKYACFVDGRLMGRVSSTSFNGLLEAIRIAAKK